MELSGAVELTPKPNRTPIDGDVETVQGQFARHTVLVDRPHGQYDDTLISRKFGCDPAAILAVEFDVDRFVWSQFLSIDIDLGETVIGRFWRMELAIERMHGVDLSNLNAVRGAVNRARSEGIEFPTSYDYGYRPFLTAPFSTVNWSIEGGTCDVIWFDVDDIGDGGFDTAIAAAAEAAE